MLAHVDAHMRSDSIYTAAYSLWRINAIHPWAEANGRVSRSIAYVVLCVGMGRLLPGTVTIPELIARYRYDYQDGLKAADLAFKKGKIDLYLLTEQLEKYLDVQIQSARLALDNL
jgi:Fic family protein